MIALRSSLSRHFLIAALGLVAAPGDPQEGGYRFRCIAGDEGPLDDFLERAPSINHAGVVAFFASHDSGVKGVYTSDGEHLNSVADSSGRLDTFGPGFPVINDQGVVAFRAGRDDGGSAILLGDGDRLRTLASTDELFEGFGGTSIYSSPSLAGDGSVAFYAIRRDGGSAIYRVDPRGQPEEIANDAGPFHALGDAPWIDHADAVTFFARHEQEGVGIFRVDLAGRTGKVVTDRRVEGITGTFSCNNSGAVAIRAVRADGTIELLVVDQDEVRVVADTKGPFRDFGNLALNDRGDVVFTALHDDGPFGIYDGPSLHSDYVIRHGDLLDGRAVRYLSLSRRGLDDEGRIAFYAGFDDDEGGIYVAHPVLAAKATSTK